MFKKYQQKRGRGVRFPLEQFLAAPLDYKGASLSREVLAILLSGRFDPAKQYMVTCSWKGLNVWEAERFFESYEDASAQDTCNHEFGEHFNKPKGFYRLKVKLFACTKCNFIKRELENER